MYYILGIIALLGFLGIAFTPKRYVKFNICCFVCCFISCVVLFIMAMVDWRSESDFSVRDEWVDSFISGNYVKCDTLVSSDKDKLLIGGSEYTGSFEMSFDMYKDILKAVSDCIESVGVSDNTLIIKYRKYTKIVNISIDEDEIKSNIDSYLKSDLSEKDIEERLRKLYYTSFKDNVISELEDEISTYSGDITIKDKKVSGIFNIIRGLIEESNLLDNIMLYEERIYPLVNVNIRE